MMDSVQSLSKLLDCDMTARAAMRVSINTKRIEEIIEPVREQEIKIYQKYGTETETEKGTAWIVQTAENKALVQQEMDELVGDDIELNILQISSTDIKSDVTPRDLAELDWLFDDIE